MFDFDSSKKKFTTNIIMIDVSEMIERIVKEFIERLDIKFEDALSNTQYLIDIVKEINVQMKKNFSEYDIDLTDSYINKVDNFFVFRFAANHSPFPSSRTSVLECEVFETDMHKIITKERLTADEKLLEQGFEPIETKLDDIKLYLDRKRDLELSFEVYDHKVKMSQHTGKFVYDEEVHDPVILSSKDLEAIKSKIEELDRWVSEQPIKGIIVHKTGI